MGVWYKDIIAMATEDTQGFIKVHARIYMSMAIFSHYLIGENVHKMQDL